MSESADGSMDGRGSCARCGDVIGVYEPAVWTTDDGRVVIASPLAVDPRALPPSVVALHLACWKNGRTPEASAR